MNNLPMLLSSMLGACPTILVQIVALVIAISRWNRHPRVSMLIATSMGVGVLVDLLIRVTYVVLPQRLSESGASIQSAMTVVGIVSGVLHTLTLGLLVAAAFVDREPARGESFSR